MCFPNKNNGLSAAGEPDPKEVNTADVMYNAYQQPEAFNRLSPFFTKSNIQKGVDYMGNIPTEDFNTDYNVRGFFTPRGLNKYGKQSIEQNKQITGLNNINDETIYLNRNKLFENSADATESHERTHGFHYGLLYNADKKTQKGIDALKEKVSSYINPETPKNSYNDYLSSYTEVLARLNALRADRYVKSKGQTNWWDNWDNLDNAKDSEAYKDLKAIMKEEDIIKALNELALNKQNNGNSIIKYS